MKSESGNKSEPRYLGCYNSKHAFHSTGGASDSSPRCQPWVTTGKDQSPGWGERSRFSAAPAGAWNIFCPFNPRFHRGLLSIAAPQLPGYCQWSIGTWKW